jgi:hypothetical protein
MDPEAQRALLNEANHATKHKNYQPREETEEFDNDSFKEPSDREPSSVEIADRLPSEQPAPDLRIPLISCGSTAFPPPSFHRPYPFLLLYSDSVPSSISVTCFSLVHQYLKFNRVKFLLYPSVIIRSVSSVEAFLEQNFIFATPSAFRSSIH